MSNRKKHYRPIRPEWRAEIQDELGNCRGLVYHDVRGHAEMWIRHNMMRQGSVVGVLSQRRGECTYHHTETFYQPDDDMAISEEVDPEDPALDIPAFLRRQAD